MTRLQAEFQRLYQLPGTAASSDRALALVGAAGQARAMVMELARPPNWEALALVWQGVQADLELPAPAIAVSGIDGYQLWFSLARPVPAAVAARFMALLQARYLGEIAPGRIALRPSGASGSTTDCEVRAVPRQDGDSGHWSAYVASDLAALFTDEPWLDLPPNEEAQADLLSRLRSIQPEEFERAQSRLASAPPPVAATPAPARQVQSLGPEASSAVDARRFLLGAMNDPSVELHLRIEAAKALLAARDAPGSP